MNIIVHDEATAELTDAVVFNGGGQQISILAVAHTARQQLYWSLRRRNN